jgi:uncharacterized MAPEG superfamily protein
VSALLSLELSIALWLAHIVVQGVFASSAVGASYLASNRDAQPRGADDVPYARATRALRNYIENFVPFVAADLGLMVTHHAPEWGATIWILARIAYLPLYVAGVSPARSIAWVISVIGLVIMLVSLAL